MAVVIVIVCLPITANAEEHNIPLIRMTGGQAPLTDIENPDIVYSSSYDLSQEAMGEIVDKIKEPLFAAVKKLDWAEAGRIAGAFLWQVFGDLQMYPNGTSRNYIYRQETTPVPGTGYDDKAYASPKSKEKQAMPVERYAAELFGAENGTEPESSQTPKENNGFFKCAATALANALKGLGKKDPRAKQPEPEPSWINIDLLNTSVYKFAFDWRQSPIDVADQLNDYVKAVKKHAGAEKVYIQSLSASGAVALAYINEYVNKRGNEDVAGIFMSIPLANGMGILGAGYQKKILPDARALACSYSLPFIGELDHGIRLILSILHTAGIMDLICSLFEFFPVSFLDSMFDSAFIPLYGTFPGIWALVPPDMYNDAKEACFGSQTNIEAVGYSDFMVKIDAYHSLQLNSHKILQQAAAKNNFKIAVVAGYGSAGWPLASNQGRQADGVVETVYASFGATVSKLGETLGGKYKQKNTSCGHNHVSPDNEIDASTTALPEYTWFIKGAVHGEQNEWNGLFAWWCNTSDPTVNSNERWPQYLYAYGNTDENGQDGVYPLQTPVYKGLNKITMRLGAFWNRRILTPWNYAIFTLTGKISLVLKMLRGFLYSEQR
jgi:hypothetical protein